MVTNYKVKTFESLGLLVNYSFFRKNSTLGVGCCGKQIGFCHSVCLQLFSWHRHQCSLTQQIVTCTVSLIYMQWTTTLAHENLLISWNLCFMNSNILLNGISLASMAAIQLSWLHYTITFLFSHNHDAPKTAITAVSNSCLQSCTDAYLVWNKNGFKFHSCELLFSQWLKNHTAVNQSNNYNSKHYMYPEIWFLYA